jgi:putative tricarboxylic transport membrane protein
VLRATAAIMAAVAALLLLASRGSRRKPIDVADHSGRI